ncbi:exonuclease SbcCD subunit D [Paenibacillaceae bacterium WGS1546]|uniref:metallophosphoesterase family protein n=1 Tax=Cohnella sp. WGS1546 TaxID=3366810 RepID=UPI00372D3743
MSGVGAPFTFVHAADLHLDSPFKGLDKAPAAVRDRLRESTFAALRALCELAARERADFVVLAGDLFDAADRSLRAQLRLERALGELARQGIPTFVAHGNHDPEGGGRARPAWPEGVTAFGSAGVECYPAYTRAGELAAHVYGISYPSAAVTDNLALRFRKREGAPFHLAVLHANVDGDPAHDNYAPCKLADLSAAGFDYWALGHVHDRRTLREYPHVVYPGNTQGRSVREPGGKGAYVVSVTGAGAIDMRFCELADVLWQEIGVSIEGADDERQLLERMLRALAEAGKRASGRPIVARVRLEGRGSLHERLVRTDAAEMWLAELRECLASPETTESWIWPESVVVRTSGRLRLEDAAAEDGFLGEALRRGLAAADDPAKSRELLEDALDGWRRQPKLREWLAALPHEERAETIRRAMEVAAALLREDEADE